MYINKKIELRGSFPLILNESFKNILKKKKNNNLINSLSTNNITINPNTSRQFGKDIKNIINLTVNTNELSIKENIEEQINYYKKIRDDLSKMLNDYDKNFFEKNKKFSIKSINLRNEEKNILNENYLNTNGPSTSATGDENKNRNIKNEKIINKDNNISYLENYFEVKKEKIKKNKVEMYMEKTVNINIINKEKKKYFSNRSISINIKNKTEKDKEKEKEEININNKTLEINKENKDSNNQIIEKQIIEKEKGQDIMSTNNNNTCEQISNYIKNKLNPQEVDEYFDDILSDIQLREKNTFIDPDYIKNTQKSINRKMRSILIDWLIDVHKKYKLKPETIYLTVNIIDRYLSIKSVATINLQLVGVVSLLIASKYEDIYPPKIRELADITDGAYIPNQLIIMENKIISSLNFDLFYPTQWHFLECYRKKLYLNEITFCLAWYLMELSLIDICFINYKGSIIASTVVMIAMKYFNSYREKEFENATGYNEKKLENCSKDILFLWSNNKNEKNLSAVRRKFSHGKFFEVAKFKIQS